MKLLISILIVIIACNAVNGRFGNPNIDIHLVADVEEYHEKSDIFDRMDSVYDDVRGMIIYSLGRRVVGDRLVATSAKNSNWPQPQNVAVTLNYPTSGIGATLTYVNVNVTQSTSLGRAYVSRGGIGQRQITVVVESYSTMYMNYAANLFGF